MKKQKTATASEPPLSPQEQRFRAAKKVAAGLKLMLKDLTVREKDRVLKVLGCAQKDSTPF